MTIGYGASDPFFNDCFSMAFVISFQSVIGTILDAICIGLLYDRISRATVGHPVSFVYPTCLSEAGVCLFVFFWGGGGFVSFSLCVDMLPHGWGLNAQSRASTVLFSRYAIISERDGMLWFKFRAVEMRKHQMVETHARIYVVRHGRDGPDDVMQYFQVSVWCGAHNSLTCPWVSENG